jgi:hypothetical protein
LNPDWRPAASSGVYEQFELLAPGGPPGGAGGDAGSTSPQQGLPAALQQPWMRARVGLRGRLLPAVQLEVEVGGAGCWEQGYRRGQHLHIQACVTIA